jgi:GTPase
VTDATPAVAIVGRPNVGKSTLFNRLIRSRRAIVHDQPGMTRDRIVATAELEEGRPVRWIDTGGLVPGEQGIGINDQVKLAVEASDLVLFVVDGSTGLSAADERVRDELRRMGRPMVLAVNKADRRDSRQSAPEFWALGVGEPHAVSAEHGEGVAALVEAIAAALPPSAIEPAGAGEELPVAIVGRPNVGKSSLLNRIVGSERVLVSPVPGTTRDPIDTVFEHEGARFRIVDTAGIRRRGQVSGAPEELAVLLAKRQIERAEICVLVVEAPAGVTTGDLAVAGAIWEAGRAAVVAVNKWDLLDEPGRERLDASWPRLDELLCQPPRVNISATSGRGVERLFPAILGARSAFGFEIGTGELNRRLETWISRHQPPAFDGKRWKLLYATQVSTRPPTFMLFANRALPIGHAYRRYLENRMREDLGLSGIPIRFVVRRRSTRDVSVA